MFCAECNDPRVVGSRCLRCYVWRMARFFKVNKFLWFTCNVERFKNALQGRMIAIQEGYTPLDKEALINGLFKTGGDRRRRVNHSKKARYSNLKKIEKIVNAVDKFTIEGMNANKDNNNGTKVSKPTVGRSDVKGWKIYLGPGRRKSN